MDMSRRGFLGAVVAAVTLPAPLCVAKPATRGLIYRNKVINHYVPAMMLPGESFLPIRFIEKYKLERLRRINEVA